MIFHSPETSGPAGHRLCELGAHMSVIEAMKHGRAYVQDLIKKAHVAAVRADPRFVL
jgi:hypothetical protein